MNNEELGRIHLENKKRKKGNNNEFNVEVEVQVEVQAEPVQVPPPPQQLQVRRHLLCLDLTEDQTENEEQQQIPYVQEDVPHVRRRRIQHVPRVLPAQDIEFLQEAEEEFAEVVPFKKTALDRLQKYRGTDKNTAIVICEDILCDCTTKCIEGYECYANRHVMCIKLITDDRKCYLCGSKIV